MFIIVINHPLPTALCDFFEKQQPDTSKSPKDVFPSHPQPLNI